MTYHQALAQGATYLMKHQITDAESSARFLLADILQDSLRDVKPEEMARFRTYLERRAQHEPVGYILGRTIFDGLTITVSRNVLVPCPETEDLVNRTASYAQTNSIRKITEVGTGSGAIAIALAKRLPGCQITATDISSQALTLAQANALSNQVQITFLHANLLMPVDSSSLLPELDMIVANLPYLPSAEIETLEPEVWQFEPRLALDGGPDGLDLYRQLATQIRQLKTKPRAIFCEIDETHGQNFIDLWPDYAVTIEQDLAGLNRYATILSSSLA